MPIVFRTSPGIRCPQPLISIKVSMLARDRIPAKDKAVVRPETTAAKVRTPVRAKAVVRRLTTAAKVKTVAPRAEAFSVADCSTKSRTQNSKRVLSANRRYQEATVFGRSRCPAG
jgi:hypothetical protein